MGVQAHIQKGRWLKPLRVIERYLTIQGEGPRTGRKTQFIRFAGCNMRCPGWPCDTPQAIFPDQWYKNSEKIPWDTLAKLVTEDNIKVGCVNISLTGGEPFMQDTDALEFLVTALKREGYGVEAWTNGSFEFPEWALREIDFVMDWKLPGSGEAGTNVKTRTLNAVRLKHTDVIKFVVKDQTDLKEAVVVYQALTQLNCHAEFWVCAAWGHISNQGIVTFVMENKLPWRLGTQLHKYIFTADEGAESSAGGHEWSPTI